MAEEDKSTPSLEPPSIGGFLRRRRKKAAAAEDEPVAAEPAPEPIAEPEPDTSATREPVPEPVPSPGPADAAATQPEVSDPEPEPKPGPLPAPSDARPAPEPQWATEAGGTPEQPAGEPAQAPGEPLEPEPAGPEPADTPEPEPAPEPLSGPVTEPDPTPEDEPLRKHTPVPPMRPAPKQSERPEQPVTEPDDSCTTILDTDAPRPLLRDEVADEPERTAVIPPVTAGAGAAAGAGPARTAPTAPTATDTREQTATPRRPRFRPKAPFHGRTAAAVAGLAAGVLLVLATAAATGACELLSGTSSCRGTGGLLLLVAVAALACLVGAAVLRWAGETSPVSTSLLALGVVAVVALLVLGDQLLAWWMLIAVPVLSVAAYVLSHWVSNAVVDTDD